MPPYGPVSWRRLVKALRHAGFDGPYSGSRHAYMLRGNLRVPVPTPHGGDIGTALLHRVLMEAGITRDEWEAL
jgi:hypothetical protein